MFGHNSDSVGLFLIVRFVLTLSHEIANVKSDFSVNGAILIDHTIYMNAEHGLFKKLFTTHCHNVKKTTTLMRSATIAIRIFVGEEKVDYIRPQTISHANFTLKVKAAFKVKKCFFCSGRLISVVSRLIR